MHERFADLPEALASTVEIAERCAYRPRTHHPILPRFSVGDSVVDEASGTMKPKPFCELKNLTVPVAKVASF